MGLVDANLALIEVRQFGAALEHVVSCGHVVSTLPVVIASNYHKASASLEHGCHVHHLVGVEIVQEKTSQT